MSDGLWWKHRALKKMKGRVEEDLGGERRKDDEVQT